MRRGCLYVYYTYFLVHASLEVGSGEEVCIVYAGKGARTPPPRRGCVAARMRSFDGADEMHAQNLSLTRAPESNFSDGDLHNRIQCRSRGARKLQRSQAGRTVIGDCRFRKRGTEHVSEYGIERMSRIGADSGRGWRGHRRSQGSRGSAARTTIVSQPEDLCGGCF
jgi:hypothetical protein